MQINFTQVEHLITKCMIDHHIPHTLVMNFQFLLDFLMAHRVVWSCLVLFLAFSQCQDNHDSFAWDSKDSIKFGTAQPSIPDSALDIDFMPKISFRYQTIDGRNIFVFDNILTPVQLTTFMHYLNIDLGAWKFSLREPYEGGPENPSDNIPWVNNVDCVEFIKSSAGRVLQKAVMDAAGTKGIYYPYKVRGKLVRRGDYTKLHTDANRTVDEYSAMMFLNPKWRKNDYGELYLYDEDNEIVAGAVPKFGRVVVWPSSVAYLPRPPSIAFKKGQLLLHVHFTKSKEKFLKSHAENTAAKYERAAAYAAGFVGSNAPAPMDINVAQHQVSEHQSTEGKKIFVIDDLFDRDDLDKLRAFILKHGTYYYDDTDLGDEDNDNVQWIAGFEIDDYVQSRLWNIMQQGLKFVSRGQDKWFPYDISCNLIRSADHARVHRDCESHEDEWTFLIYLTPNWTKNDYGETAFYESATDDTEIITEVRPRYGRAVIFQGIIPHSARPPSTNQSQARLTFVAKVSVNEFVGRSKAFVEEMRHFQGVVEQSQTLDLIEQRKEIHAKQFHAHGDEKLGSKDDDQREDFDGAEDDSEEEDWGEEREENDGATHEEEETGHHYDDEDDIDDPQIKELMSRFEETSHSGNLEKIRTLHRELHARHVAERQHVFKRISNLI